MIVSKKVFADRSPEQVAPDDCQPSCAAESDALSVLAPEPRPNQPRWIAQLAQSCSLRISGARPARSGIRGGRSIDA